MSAVILAILACGVSLLILLRDPVPPVIDDENPVPDEDQEHLREILINHTGHQIGQLRRERGNWIALTMQGWVSVSEILRGPKWPGAGRWN